MSRQGSSHDEYEFIEKIGDGSFGQVYKARNKTTHQVVAVKTVKHKYGKSLEDTSDYKLREYRALRSLEWHPNIVQLHKSFVASPDELHLVMEYVNGGNLCDFINERRTLQKPIEHCEVRRMLRQLLEALAHIHRHGIFHRDLKPENILISRPDFIGGMPIIKLGDFGLARSIYSQGPYTEYVSTRWYRAPEVLLRYKSYSYPVDLWAVGAIFAELITTTPLFPGSSEIDQLYRICSVLGSPGTNKLFNRKTSMKPERRCSPGFARKAAAIAAATAEQRVHAAGEPDNEWKEGVKLAQRIGFMFPQLAPKPLSTVVPNASAPMLDLLRQFLYYDPARRMKADKALLHPFIVDEPVCHKHGARLRHDSIHRDGKKLRTNYNSSAVLVNEKDIAAVDLLAAPATPLQICPVWDYDRPGYIQLANANAQLSADEKDDDFQGTNATSRMTASSIPSKDRFLSTATTGTITTTSAPFSLDTIAHYGKQLTTWQLPSDTLQKPYKTPIDTKEIRHSNEVMQTLKFHHKERRPRDGFVRTHASSSSSHNEETSSDCNSRVNSWPWLKVL